MTFFVSSLLFLRRNLPPAAAIEHLFHWTDKHPSLPWLFAFLTIPCRLWIRLFTTPLFDGKLFCPELSLFFCKLSSTPCCFKSPPFSSGEYSSSTELSDAVYKPTVGTFVYSPVILTEWSSPGLVKFFFFPPLACLNTPIFRPGKKAAYVLFLFFFIHVLSCCFLIRKTKLFGQRFLQDVISWISFSKAWLTTCIWRLQNFKRSRKDAIVLNVFPWCQLSGPDVISLRSNTIKLNFGKLSVLIPSHLIIVLATDT